MTTSPIHQRHRRTALLIVLGAASLGLTACGSSEENPAENATASTATSYPVTVNDCAGKVSFEKQPSRVLTIGSAAISLLDAAGASDKITTRTGEFGADLPAGLATPPTDAKIVDPSDPSAEAIIGAGADVVYGYGLFNAKPEALEQAGVPLLTVAGECGHDATAGESQDLTFATVTDDIRRLGTVFGTKPVADKNADAIDARVSDLSAQAKGADATAAWLYYFSSTDPLSAYGATSMADAVLDSSKLKNVFGSEDTSYLEVTMESLLKQDPAWLVLSYGLYGESESDARKQLLAEAGAEDLTAVKNDRLILVPGTSSEPSQQSVDGLDKIVTAVSDAG